MHVSKRGAMALLAAAALAGSALSGAPAFGAKAHRADGHHHHVRTLIDTSLAPSVPTDPPLFGVMAGAAPWVLQVGRAQLRGDGRLHVVIRGLVIPVAPFSGTPGPVTTVNAALYCDDRSPAAATSPSVPISRTGDATIDARLALPGKCLAASLLIHPNGLPNLYIAASGFGG